MAKDITEIRKVRVLGPRIAQDQEYYLWVADLAADILHTLTPDGAFMRNASLRVLSETVKTREYQGWNKVDSTDKDPRPLAFHDPHLLQVAARLEKGRSPRLAFLAHHDGEGDAGASTLVEGQTDGFPIFTAAPLGEWPDKSSEHVQVEAPPLLLVGGRIDLAIRKGTDNDLWKVLNVDEGVTAKDGSEEYFSVLGKNKDGSPHVYVRGDKGSGGVRRLLAFLTARGIELECLMRDPFDPTAKTPTIKATLRIEPDDTQAGDLRLALVLPPEDAKEQPRFRPRLDGLLASLRETAAPLVIRIRPGELALFWRLSEEGGKHKVPDFFAPSLLPGTVQVSLVTAPAPGGTIGSVAELRNPLAKIVSEVGAKRRIEIEAGSLETSVEHIQAAIVAERVKDSKAPFESFVTYLAKAKDDNRTPTGWNMQLPIAVDTSSLHSALHARYVASGLRHADSQEPLYAFLALERGVVQVPVFPPQQDPATKAAATAASDETRTAFDGSVLAQVASNKATFTVVVDRATHVFAQADFVGDAPVDCVKVSAQFSRAVGTFSGALWMSERSPSAQEVAPTLEAGPIALLALPLSFSDDKPQNGLVDTAWRGKMAPVLGERPAWIELAVKRPQDSPYELLHWAPRSRLALVAAMNMTRTGGNATFPSQTRDLVPFLYPLDQTNPVTVSLEADAGFLPRAKITATSPPRMGWYSIRKEIDSDGKKDCRSVSLIALTLPGVEYAPKPGPAWELLPSLRFDLPILGELFAPAAEQPNESAARAPIVSALDPAGLERAWADAARRLALTRTKKDRAIGWPPNSAKINGLVEPFDWLPTFSVEEKAQGSDSPLGTYQLGKLAPVSGEDALPGLSDVFDAKAGTLDIDRASGKLKITGFALAPYNGYALDGKSAVTDTRGLVMARVPEFLNGLAIRRFGLVKPSVASDPEVRALVTTHKAIGIDLGAGRSAELWLRDVPMGKDGSGWAFAAARPLEDEDKNSTAHPEAGLGPDPRVFDRNLLPESVYEWRLFEPATDSEPGSYDIAIGGLVFRPLRLWSLKLNAVGQAIELTVVYSVGLPLPRPTVLSGEKDKQEPFLNDDAYGMGNTIAVTYAPNAVLGKLAVKSVVKVSAGPTGLTLGGVGVSQAELAFDFEAWIRYLGTEQPPDSRQTQAARLSFKIEVAGGKIQSVSRSGTLALRLFGRSWSFKDMLVAIDGELTATFTLAGSSGSVGLLIEKATVKLLGSGAAVHPITLQGRLRLDPRTKPSGPAPLQIELGGNIRWFGAIIQADWSRADIDHQRGAMRLVWNALPCSRNWIRGLPLDGGTADVMIAVAFETGAALIDAAARPVLPVTAAHVEIAARCPAATPKATLRYWLTLSAPPTWFSRLTLSITPGTPTRSRIGWPVGAITLSDAKDYLSAERFSGQLKATNVKLTPGTPSLEHMVTPHLVDADLDPELIATDSAEVWILRRPWRLKVFTEHRLTEPGAANKAALWNSLDDLTIVDMQALATDLKDLANPPRRTYGYSPRYRQPLSGKLIFARSEDVPGAGIVRVGEFGEVLGQVLAGASDAGSGLALFGGAVIEVPLDPGRTRGLVFSLPWLAPLPFAPDTAEALKPLNAIPQLPTAPETVTVAGFDLAAAIPIALDPADRLTLAIGQGSLLEVKRTLEAAFGPDAIASNNAVDRAFTSNLPGPPAPWSPSKALTTPIYWRCLMALARLWKDTQFKSDGKETLIETATLLGLPNGGQALRVTLGLDGLSDQAGGTEGAAPADLLVLAHSRVAISPLSGLDSISVANPGDGEALGRLARTAWTLAADPLGIWVAWMVEDGGRTLRHHKTFMPVPLPAELDPAPTTRALRSKEDTVFASPGLGWPAKPDISERHHLSMGDETPLQDADHAWAGRARTLGGHLSAYAAEPTDESAKFGRAAYFLALGRRVLFQRIAEPLIAPADRGLMPVAPRVRVPLAKSIEDALTEVDGAVSPRVAAVLPGQYETISTGVRAGVMVMEHEGLIVASPARSFDPEHDRFGRPAHRASLVWHQGRAPRSTRLPLELNLAKSRRTFIGENLTPVDQARHTPFLLLRGPGSVLRYQPKSIGGTTVRGSDKADANQAIITVPISVVTPRLGRLGPDFAGEITLRLDRPKKAIKSDNLDFEDALARLGLLRDKGPSATLIVGDVSGTFTQAAYVKIGMANDRIELTLKGLSSPARAGLRAAMAAAGADTDARLVLWLAESLETPTLPAANKAFDLATKARTLQAGPPLTITIPLPLVPTGRPWLPIETATVAFGDPAYDRELGGPAATRIVPITVNGAQITFLLALDRRDYDPAATIHFAFGAVNPQFRIPLPPPKVEPFDEQENGTGWFLRIQLLRAQSKATDKPDPLDLSVQGVNLASIVPGKAYALPIQTLLVKPGVAASPAPGDRLRLTVEGNDKSGAPVKNLSVDVGIAKDPVLAPPSAIYGLVTLDKVDQDLHATPALFAAAPLPTTIEYPDLLGDLVRGHVRRRGLFIWRFVPRQPPLDGKPYAGLVKIDRTGGGQVPSRTEEFEPFWITEPELGRGKP